MQKAVNLSAIRIGRVTMERVAELLVKRYEIDDVVTATNVILAHADNLLYMMDHPKRKSIQYFTSEPIYEQLSSTHSVPAADLRRAGSIELRPRRDYSTLESESSSESDSSSSLETPKRQPRRKKKGRLSVLRDRKSVV